MLGACRGCGRAGGGCRGHLHRRWRPGGFAIADHGHRPLDDVVEVQGELPVLLRREQLEQVDQVGAVELRGSRGQAPRQIGVADDRHAVVGDDGLILDGALDVAAIGGGHVDEHTARLHRGDHLRGDDARCGLTRDQRGGDDDVDVGGQLRIQRGLAFLVVVAHLLGVTGRRDLILAGRVGCDGHVLPAQGAHLIGDLGPGVGGLHDGAQAPGRADRGQSGHPRADDEHLGRRHLARGGHLPGEEPAEAVRGLDHCAVPGDVRHRRQHVQRLRSRDTRNGVHRQHGDGTRGQLLHQLRVQPRGDQTDQRRAVTHGRDLCIGRGVDLEDDVSGQCLSGGADTGPGLDVGRIGEAGGSAGTRFDDDGVAQFEQLPDGLGRGGHPRFTLVGFARYPDDHPKSLPSASRRPACRYCGP